MDSSNLELRLSELRRELEEVLLMIKANPSGAEWAPHRQREDSWPNLGDANQEASQPAKPCDAGGSVPAELYDNALCRGDRVWSSVAGNSSDAALY